jgi:alpha-glucosidase
LKEGAAYRYVYFPEDEWVNLWTGKVYEGGYKKIEASIGEIPVFVRKSAVDLSKLVEESRKVAKVKVTIK